MAVLNSLVRKDLKGNTALLHEWDSARRIRKAPVASAAAPATPVAPVASSGQTPLV
jgi:hypothetical protein